MAESVFYHLELTESPQQPAQLSSELLLLYLAAGTLELTFGVREFSLHQYDLFSIDPGTEYSMRSSQDAIVCILRFSGSFVEEMLAGGSGRFTLNSAGQPDLSYGRLRHLFTRLLSFDRTQHRTLSGEGAIILEIFSLLTDSFFIPDPAEVRFDHEDSSRMRLIMQYITSHLHTECSISELSERLYLSQPALSRYFKKKTGVLFSDYVNSLKMSEAARLITATDEPFAHISSDLGFSGPSSFYHAFARQYGMTPAEYRRKYRDDAQSIMPVSPADSAASATDTLRSRLREKLPPLPGRDTQTVSESIDVRTRRDEKFSPGRLRLISAGAFGDMLMVNAQHHILMLKEILDIRYVRIWNPFSSRLKITDGMKEGDYNYDLADQVLDFLVRNGIRPFIDYGIRENRALRSRNETIFIERENILFATKELWEAALKAFLRHVITRYGEEEVTSWGFELFDTSYISDSGPLPYLGSEDYDEAFLSFYRIVKDLLPAAMCGPGFISTYPALGDGVSGARYVHDPDKLGILHTFFRSCTDSGCLPDFISVVFHCYDQKASPYGLDQDIMMLSSLRRTLNQFGMGDTKVFVTEWYSSVSSRNYLNDSCYRAAYFIRKFSEAAGLADMYAAAIASDWVSNYFDSHSVANGGNGLLTRTSIKKPLLVMLEMLCKMPSAIISRNEHTLMTCNDRGEMYLLCYNFPIDKASEYELNEILSDPPSAEAFIDSHRSLELRITLRGILSQGKYAVRMESLSEQEGTILSGWKQFGFENELEEYEIRYIRESVYLRMNTRRLSVTDQSMNLSVTLPPFGAALFTIRKV